MKAIYRHQSELAHGNILWEGLFPMRAGAFPRNHPCYAPGEVRAGDVQFGTSDALQTFRERGYWASCFPEGDGITMKAEKEQTPEQVVQDIKECFGWEVVLQVWTKNGWKAA